MSSTSSQKNKGRKSGNPWFILAIVILLVMALGLWYVFFKPARNIEGEEGLRVSADTIYNAYLKDEKTANKLYLDKAITVKGKISEIKTNQQGQQVIILQTGDPVFGIVCTMSRTFMATKGDEVNIKGFCTGYTTDVVLRDCINENK